MAGLGTLLSGAIRIAIPICFGALACTICERGGIVNIGVEGMMLAGSFGGVLGSYLTGSAWVGLLFAILAGVLFAAIHAVLTIKYKTGHIISGLGINLLASGLTTVLLVSLWDNRGKSDAVASLGTINIPVLKDIPVLGDILSGHSPLFYILIVIGVVMWIVLYKTVFGLRVRVVGENPQTADSVGINVTAIQYICVLACGAIAGLGGAYLSIGDIGLFSRDMVAGRGYIAMAVTIFGGWNPIGAFGGSLLFGVAQSIQFRLQEVAPVQIIQMLPYILTILVLILVKNRPKGPAAAGKSFDREAG
ncbi:ABC transporter permease [Oscillospiraceae bacterium NSJ-54]|uniref:ABC transporter permease n=1 Tax=Zongyangia hominis TaxID=2763677 RepID=A0A926IB13_9FIRM|nr:ABC transporter permease [Zongyangia hominis]